MSKFARKSLKLLSLRNILPFVPSIAESQTSYSPLPLRRGLRGWYLVIAGVAMPRVAIYLLQIVILRFCKKPKYLFCCHIERVSAKYLYLHF
ncbi:hypothetical protein [Helicobacter sp. T3_23-1059]